MLSTSSAPAVDHLAVDHNDVATFCQMLATCLGSDYDLTPALATSLQRTPGVFPAVYQTHVELALRNDRASDIEFIDAVFASPALACPSKALRLAHVLLELTWRHGSDIETGLLHAASLARAEARGSVHPAAAELAAYLIVLRGHLGPNDQGILQAVVEAAELLEGPIEEALEPLVDAIERVSDYGMVMHVSAAAMDPGKYDAVLHDSLERLCVAIPLPETRSLAAVLTAAYLEEGGLRLRHLLSWQLRQLERLIGI